MPALFPVLFNKLSLHDKAKYCQDNLPVKAYFNTIIFCHWAVLLRHYILYHMKFVEWCTDKWKRRFVRFVMQALQNNPFCTCRSSNNLPLKIYILILYVLKSAVSLTQCCPKSCTTIPFFLLYEHCITHV